MTTTRDDARTERDDAPLEPQAARERLDALLRAVDVERDGVDELTAARRHARRLGAHWHGDHATFGFWVPELVRRGVDAERVTLELVDVPDVDLAVPEQTVRVRVAHVPVTLHGEYAWAAVTGVRPGRRERLGTLYQLVYRATGPDGRERRHTAADPLAASLPFGGLGPAELYDADSLHAGRGDAAYYADLAGSLEDGRVPPPTNILQLHVPSATSGGTLADLAERVRALGDALRAGTAPADLPPHLQLLDGYDALQPLPLEPTIEYELGPRFVHRVDDGPEQAEEQTWRLARPDVTNWGYDILLHGSAATNPRLLRTGRPDELVDLAVALHTLPRPMRLVLDVVYGHTDNQALGVLDPRWFRGPNMYGQDVNQQHPVVRACVLEMQRRKVDHGADGVRVDGAQDFTTWDEVQRVVAHDDDFLELMAGVPQQVCGVDYLPWFVFEDGRPWPREDWPVASTYRAVIDRQPHAFQWGPITFAHNTPALQGFWQERWWRVEQILTTGSHWVSGCANHDTVRRGTQIPLEAAVNTALGDSMPRILAEAYDNPAAWLLTYAAFPGVPMDFLNATARAPWAFVRNTDDRYGVKVVAEEGLFAWWQLDEERWQRLDAFPRLRARGVRDLGSLRRVLAALAVSVEAAGDDLVDAAARMALLQEQLDVDVSGVAALKAFARDYMDDVEALCDVDASLPVADPARLAFARQVRGLRLQRPWLRDDLTGADSWGREESQGALVVHVHRQGPGGERVLLVANLAGTDADVVPLAAEHVGEEGGDGWHVALTSPGLDVTDPARPVVLRDSAGLVLTRPD